MKKFNKYKEQELESASTVAKIATVQIEKNQSIIRQIDYYNLDVIISVGYRVKSLRGTQSRQWANKILKDYLLNGYALNQRISAIESTMEKHSCQLQAQQEKIDFFVRTALPPVEGIFYDGHLLERAKGTQATVSTSPLFFSFPLEAKAKGITGTVLVKFVVEKDGSISNAKVIVPLYPACDEAALRGVQSMPHWIPATKQGEPVRSYYSIPFAYHTSKAEMKKACKELKAVQKR